MTDIEKITNELLTYLDECHTRFLKREEPGKERAFFERVKSEVDPIFHLLNQWKEGTSVLIQQKGTDLYQQQVDSTVENMQALILHSYYIDVRKRRFMEMYKSCYYIFTQLKKGLTINE